MSSEHTSTKPDINDSFQYTPAYVEAILTANDLLVRKWCRPCSNSYAYPLAPLNAHTLLLDTLRYVYYQPEQPTSPARCVCFLLPHQNNKYYGVILLFNGVNAESFQAIKTQIRDVSNDVELTTKLSDEPEQCDPVLIEHLRNLCPEIRVCFLGSAQNKQISSDLDSILKQAYVGTLPLKFQPTSNHVIFVEHMLTLLKRRKIFEIVNPKVALCEHHGQCIHGIVRNFNHLKIKNPALHEDLKLAVAALNKLTEIEAAVDKNYGIEGTEYPILETQLKLHQNTLSYIYTKPNIEFCDFLNRLPRDTLIFLLQKSFEVILTALNTEIENKVEKISQWENKLYKQSQAAFWQQNKLFICWNGVKSGLNCLLQCTHMAQGRELFHCLGSITALIMQLHGNFVRKFMGSAVRTFVESSITALTASSELGQSTGQASELLFQDSVDLTHVLATKAVKWTVTCSTFSAERGQRASDVTQTLLSPTGLPDLFAVAGAGLGLFYTHNIMLSTPWSLVKVASLGFLGRRLSVWLAPNAASFRPATRDKRQCNIIYETNLILSALHCLQQRSADPMIDCFVSHAASLFIVSLGRQRLGAHTPSFDSNKAQLPLTLWGITWGRTLAQDLVCYLGRSADRCSDSVSYQQTGWYFLSLTATCGLQASGRLRSKHQLMPLVLPVLIIDLGLFYNHGITPHTFYSPAALLGLSAIVDRLPNKLTPNFATYPANVRYWLRVANIGWSATKSIIHADQGILVDALGGLTASSTFVWLGRRFEIAQLSSAELQTEINPRDSYQSELLLSLAGFSTGQLVTQATRPYIANIVPAGFWAVPQDDSSHNEAFFANQTTTNYSMSGFTCEPRNLR